MTIWRQAGRVSFASSQDFLSEESISKNCRDSYEQYIVNTKGEELPVNENNYPVTEWSYDDNENDARYIATWNKRFSWGVMKTGLPKRKPETQNEPPKEIHADKNKNDEKQDRMIELLEAILAVLTEKSIHKANE